MQELIPVMSGLALGMLVGGLRPRLRLRVGCPLAVVLGVLASVVTGELRISWAFLLVDIPLVAVSAALSVVASRAVARRAVRNA